MPTRIYKIAGTVIRLESEEPIAENGNFKKFLVPPEKAELTAVIRRVDSLPEERGQADF